jgi:glycosyltransferase involved in cell wall biosynthesis
VTLRVGCNLLWLVPGAVGGSETATVHLLRTLASDPPSDVELTLYGLDAFGHAYPELAKAFPTRLVPLTGRLKPLRVAAENTWLPREVRGKVDIMHHMGGVVPLAPGGPSLVTLHDLQPFDLPDNFGPAKRAYLQRSIPRTVRHARLVLTASEFVRRGVVERFGVPDDHVRVTPWGVGPPSSEVSLAEVQARYGLPRRWFVYPAFTWWHKDHALAVRAFATLAAREHDVVLVLTGGEGPAEQSVMELVDSLGLRGRVRRTGLIPRRDVLAIVRGATALLYPSRYEGFGLPVAEAMSLGTPVLAADATSLPEVVGDAGWLLPPGQVDDWSEAMIRMLADGDERRRLGEAGRARAARYTWAANADATVASYRDVAAMLAAEDTSVPDSSVPDSSGPDSAAPDSNDNGVAS